MLFCYFLAHTDDTYILNTPHLDEDAQMKRNTACKTYEVILSLYTALVRFLQKQRLPVCGRRKGEIQEEIHKKEPKVWKT